jgi:hypothetical protein
VAKDRGDGRLGAVVRERFADRGVARPQRRPRPDPLQFIQANTRVCPVRSLPEIRLHTAHQATGLWRLSERMRTDPIRRRPTGLSLGPAGWRSPATYWTSPER